MTIKASTFTPQVLLASPRRSAGIPNASGTKVLYTTTAYSFEEHKKSAELRCLDVRTLESTLLTEEDNVSEPVWLDGEEDAFVCLQSGKEGGTEIIVASTAKDAKKEDAYSAGKIDASASSLKVVKLAVGRYGIVVAARACPDGSLFNAEKANKTHSTGKLFKGLFVRHWDEYVGKEKNALWYGTLQRGEDGKYKLSPLVNALKGTKLESPIAPFGGMDNFDISASGLIFVSKDPELDPALNTKVNVYLLDLATWEESKAGEAREVVLPPDYHGATTSPVFSPDAQRAAFISMQTAGYESSYNSIFIIPNVHADSNEHYVVPLAQGEWSRGYKNPQNVQFGHDGQNIYFSAEDQGYGRLFHFQLPGPGEQPLLKQLSMHGYLSDVKPLLSGLVFVSGSSLVDNSFYSLLNPTLEASSIETWSHSASHTGSSLGLSRSQVSSIQFPASNPSINKAVHAWVVKPSNFSSEKTYPLALLVHGGPQGSWADSWSTRWNPAVFAEQGYVVIAPNITGSTGYGQAFTDAIRKDWGGQPYEDLVNCFKYIEESMLEVDTSRAVALGASYGGYMMNWLNGHDLGRKFKALVCHDGIFSTRGVLATDELYFPYYDLGGMPWKSSPSASSSSSSTTAPRTELEKPAEVALNVFGKEDAYDIWKRNDPAEFLGNWTTPELVIHNSKDYRLCISDGLAAFNVLQTRGVDSQFLTFPDENHFVLKPENSLVWHKVVLNWINKYAGLPPFCEEEEVVGEEFFGGVRETGEVVNMAGMGKPET